MITALYAIALGLLLVYLSARVITERFRQKISIGTQQNPEMERAMRVQSNFVEYTPMFLVLMLLAEMQGLMPWALHVLGAGFLIARVLHFLGFRSVEAPGIFRSVGIVLTFLAILAACIANLTVWTGMG